ncbi:MAG: HIT family protein [Phycisphaerales bacterium]|jgi:histidine triad (HIT) family protein|nr:HIT family protein [Phycisphaerales bacterium]
MSTDRPHTAPGEPSAPASIDAKLPPDNVFRKIVRGELPCHRVYQDAHVLAFLDIFPIARGHTLVIPKEPVETIDQLSDAAAEALGRVLPRICRAVVKVTGCDGFNLLQNNGRSAHQEVPHVHFHVIPRYVGAGGQAGAQMEASSSGATRPRLGEATPHTIEHTPGSGLGIVWKAGKLDPADEDLARQMVRLL